METSYDPTLTTFSLPLSNHYHKIETITFLGITLWGVLQGEVTVFYLIYLFWFQELIRTIIDMHHAFKKRRASNDTPGFKLSYSSLFILLIYFIFIVVLFGILLNWHNLELLATNIQVLLFHNLYFDLTIVLFAIQYFIYRMNAEKDDDDTGLFNKNHIILHISIVIGALIQLGVVNRHPEYFAGNELWGSTLVVLPFLLLKIIMGRKSYQTA